MENVIDWLYANPELVLAGIMAAWSFVESMGWGFLSDQQRRKAQLVVRRLLGKL